jgi:release factor glutamine methyltransferase
VTLVERLRAAGCVFAEEEAELLLAADGDLEAMVRRRTSGVPLEHVLGWAAFCGMRVLVDDGVFVPRPRSELLVARAVQLARRPAAILDLCCGTGAVGLAVLSATGGELVATDLDPAAVANARSNGVAAELGDLYSALSPRRFDVITMVAPYVPSDEMPLLPHEARDFEPGLALDGGGDGLDVVRRAVAQAPQWLAPGGAFVTEVSERQQSAVLTAMTAAGLAADAHGGVVTGQYR